MGNKQPNNQTQQFRAPSFVVETGPNGVSLQFQPTPPNPTAVRLPATRPPYQNIRPLNGNPRPIVQPQSTLNFSSSNQPVVSASVKRYVYNKKPIEIVHQLKFHCRTYGIHIMLSNGRKTATRIDGKTGCSLVFSEQKIRVDEKVSIQITDVNTNLSGFLRIGVIHDHMRRIGALCKLPQSLCPHYINEGFAWGREVSAEQAKLNNIITLELTANGTAIIYVNGINKGIFLRGIDVTKSLYFVADVYGTTTAIRCTDFPHDRAVEIEKTESLGRQDTEKYLNHFCQQHGIDSTSSKVDTNLYFLPVSRKNLSLSCDNKLMKLQNDFNQNSKIIFIDNPLQADTSFLFQCVQGGFMIGVTNCNPSSIKESDLPTDHSHLKQRLEYWTIAENFLFLDSSKYFAITLTSNGNIMFDCELSDTETIIETNKAFVGYKLHLFFIFAFPGCCIRTAGTLKHEPVPDLPSGINRAMYNEHLQALKAIQKQQEVEDIKNKEQTLKPEEIKKIVSAAMDEIRPVSIEENTKAKEEQSTSTPIVDLHPTASSDSEDNNIFYHDAPSEFTYPKEIVESSSQRLLITQNRCNQVMQSLHFDSITKPMTHDTNHDQESSSMISNEFLSLFNVPSTTMPLQPTSMLSVMAQPTVPKLVETERQMSVCSSTATLSLSDEILQPQPVFLSDTPSSSGVLVEDLSVMLPHEGLPEKETEPEPSVFAEAGEECVICCDKPKTHAFIPCGHLCVCESCATEYMQKYNICLLCREPAGSVNRIFHS